MHGTINDRYALTVERLYIKHRDQFSARSQFYEHLGTYSAQYSNIKSNNQAVPVILLETLYNRFPDDVDLLWIIRGQGVYKIKETATHVGEALEEYEAANYELFEGLLQSISLERQILQEILLKLKS